MSPSIDPHDNHERSLDGTLEGPASVYSLAHVSNDELHAGARRLVGRSNQLLAALVAHLAEVEARGIHRERSCASVTTYCVYELRLSEDAAFRRARAARIAREFPVVLDHLAAGEIHLTALLLLGPHLTEQNHRELLALSKHRTKREVLRLIRRLDPAPDVPALVEPLGPAPLGVPVPRAPSWQAFFEALSPPVRELPPGDNPKDWITSAPADNDTDIGSEGQTATPQDQLQIKRRRNTPQPNTPLPDQTDCNPARPSASRCNSPPARSTSTYSKRREISPPMRCRAARSSNCTCKPCACWSPS